MNRQIDEITNIVLSLTEKLSSNIREGNCLNTLSSEPNGRSDMVTGVNNHQTTSSQKTPPNGTPRTEPTTPQLTDVMTEIHHLRSSMRNTITQPKILQTQVPLFKENREKYKEFGHLMLNYLRPHLINSQTNRSSTISSAS